MPATLEELLVKSRELSTRIRALAAEREAVDDEIAKRHAAVQEFKAAAKLSPADIDKHLQGKE